jgi:phosphatidate cytidylyltransferase
MLRTRLLVGVVLAALALVLLLLDPPPFYPGLLLLLLGLGLAAAHELLGLLGPRQPNRWLCYAGVAGLIAANWLPHLPETATWEPNPWSWVVWGLTAFVFAAFVVEMMRFHEPGEAVVRVALAVWLVAYLGLLPSFVAQLRWLPGDMGLAALLLTIFVPKGGDIGAYFTGRLLGRHPMTPVLSPKKTWEGAAGGLAAAVLVTAAVNRLGPARVLGPWWVEVGFGLTVGLAGMFGDLAESFIKRDCRQKDASQAVPGFGGVLDVVDAVLLAAPVAYLWLTKAHGLQAAGL